MNALERARNAFYTGKEDSLSARTIILAYLQFCHDHGAFHPDDYMDPETGTSGWHVLLVRVALLKVSCVDELHYPAWVLSADKVLEMLADFHSDDDDSDEDSPLHKVDWLKDFFTSMHVVDLEKALGYLEDLCVFHVDGPEMPIAHLFDMRDGIKRLVQGWCR